MNGYEGILRLEHVGAGVYQVEYGQGVKDWKAAWGSQSGMAKRPNQQESSSYRKELLHREAA